MLCYSLDICEYVSTPKICVFVWHGYMHSCVSVNAREWIPVSASYMSIGAPGLHMCSAVPGSGDSNSCLHPCMASSVSMEPSPPPLLWACWTIIGRLKEKLFKKTNEHLLGVLIVSGAVWGAESTVANKGRAFAPTHLLASGGHDNERARKQHMNTLPTVWYRSAGCKQ